MAEQTNENVTVSVFGQSPKQIKVDGTERLADVLRRAGASVGDQNDIRVEGNAADSNTMVTAGQRIMVIPRVTGGSPTEYILV